MHYIRIIGFTIYNLTCSLFGYFLIITSIISSATVKSEISGGGIELLWSMIVILITGLAFIPIIMLIAGVILWALFKYTLIHKFKFATTKHFARDYSISAFIAIAIIAALTVLNFI